MEMKYNDELHKKLIKDCNKAKRLVANFQMKMKELQEKSISEYGALLVQVYVPKEADFDLEADMDSYNLSDIEIVPLTLAHNGRLKK